MGSGIAQVAITAGYQVTLNDISMEILEKACAGIDKMLSKNVAKEKMTQTEKDAAMACLNLSSQLASAADADLVIEAAPEKAELKKTIFAQLSEICREDCIFATNTSSISIADLASSVKESGPLYRRAFLQPGATDEAAGDHKRPCN